MFGSKDKIHTVSLCVGGGGAVRRFGEYVNDFSSLFLQHDRQLGSCLFVHFLMLNEMFASKKYVRHNFL